jgi:hypothetical protein
MIKNETKSTVYVVMGYIDPGNPTFNHKRPFAVYANRKAAEAFCETHRRRARGSDRWQWYSVEALEFFPEDTPNEL